MRGSIYFTSFQLRLNDTKASFLTINGKTLPNRLLFPNFQCQKNRVQQVHVLTPSRSWLHYTLPQHGTKRRQMYSEAAQAFKVATRSSGGNTKAKQEQPE